MTQSLYRKEPTEHDSFLPLTNAERRRGYSEAISDVLAFVEATVHTNKLTNDEAVIVLPLLLHLKEMQERVRGGV